MARPTKKSASVARKKATVPARAAAKKGVGPTKAAKAVAKKAPVKAPVKAAPAKKPAKAAAAKAVPAKQPAKQPAKPAAKNIAAKKAAAQPAAAKPAKKGAATTLGPATKVTKAAAAATEPPKPKVAKPRPPKFSPKELEDIRGELLAHRATYEKEFEDLESGSLTIAQSEMSGEVSYDEEFADAGTFTFERERDLSLSNNIRDLMDKVDTAMRKLDEGTYGVCERCGNAIDKARLKALPYSVLCISCKQQEERTR